MFTIFALPKTFQGHTGIIQRNAIRSWTLLDPGVEVLLFGDDPGVAEVARDLGLRHEPRVARNELGTPLIGDVFETAQAAARHDVLCYANSDIILLQDLAPAVASVRRWATSFLLAGRRWNLDVRAPLDFAAGWQAALRARTSAEGQQQDAWWIDYFVFPRGLLVGMPPFAVGRAAWDNWVIYHARRQRVPVVDASQDVLAVHQDHGYEHVPMSRGAWRGPESDRNLELAGGRECAYTLLDATHRLSHGAVVRRLSLQPLRRALGFSGGLGLGRTLRRMRSAAASLGAPFRHRPR